MIDAWLLTGLLFKHLLFDFVLQNTAMLKGKKTYGNMHGLAHSILHGLGTVLILWNPLAAIIDAVVHYHVDYAKAKLSSAYHPVDRQYWWWMGVDQFLHACTYIFLTWKFQ